MYMNRRLHAWADAGLLISRFIRFGLFLVGIALLAALVVPIVQLAFGHPWPISNAWLVSLVAGYLIVTTLNQTIIPSLNILGHRISWLIFSTLTLISALGFSLLLAQQTSSAEYWQIGQLAGYLLGFLVAIPFFINYVNRPTRKPLTEPDSLRTIAAFTLPLAISIALNWVQFQSYRLVLVRYMNLEVLGKFVAVYILVAGLMAAFENLIQQYFYPDLYAKSTSLVESERAQAWRQFASVALPTTMIGGLTLLALGRPLVRLMLAPAFQDAFPVIVIAVITETCRVCANIYAMAGHVAMKTRALLVPQIVSAISLSILVPVCFALMPSQIELALLISLGLPALLLLGLSALYARRKLALSIPWREVSPVFFAKVFALAIFAANVVWWSDSLVLAIGELVLVGLLFSGFMAFTVVRWRRNWLTASAVPT